jgi:hypothetical protein
MLDGVNLVYVFSRYALYLTIIFVFISLIFIAFNSKNIKNSLLKLAMGLPLVFIFFFFLFGLFFALS